MDLKIPHDAFVFVGDGRKALFLRNDGDEKFPYLKTERVFVDENPPSHEIELNQQALQRLGGEKSIQIVPGATHLFEEAGALDAVTELAAGWFESHLFAGNLRAAKVDPRKPDARR